jgi:hypothetical protein
MNQGSLFGDTSVGEGLSLHDFLFLASSLTIAMMCLRYNNAASWLMEGFNKIIFFNSLESWERGLLGLCAEANASLMRKAG